MPTQTKIKIDDAVELRQKLDGIYDTASQTILAKWSILLAKHIMDIAGFANAENETILNGFDVNEAWQNGQARMHDVRQAGFKIHALSKATEDVLHIAILRVIGQAVGTGHMREHAMVASDYAVKVVNILQPDNKEAVIAEREWQITTLVKCLS